MATAIISIGLPGSGKTTYMKRLAEVGGLDYVCPEDIRAELSGDPLDQSRMVEVWGIVYRRIGEALEAGRSVVIDATMAKRADRQNMTRYCHELCDEVQGFWFVTPYDICVARNRNCEGHVVPEHAMYRMDKQLKLEPPDPSDGFDELHRINPIARVPEPASA